MGDATLDLSLMAAKMADTAVNISYDGFMTKKKWKMGEESADNADARTRRLYFDLYSPQAQAEQIRNAGLSPGLIYSKGAVGSTGHAGAQANGISNNFNNVMDLANLKLLEPQIKKTNAEAENTKKDTEQKDTIIKKTNQEIINLLDENDLTKSKVAFQNLTNSLAEYELKYKSETLQTDISARKVELNKMLQDYRKAVADAGSAEIEEQIKQSTAGAVIQQEMQKVVLNDLEALNKQTNLKLTNEQINKVKEEIIEKRLSNSWINIKNEEDIAKLRHDISVDLIQLDIKERDQNYQMTKGIIDSLISLIKPMNNQ